jgi:tRNA threonylcarbamoyladenosine biosynthesis protein TsaE
MDPAAPAAPISGQLVTSSADETRAVGERLGAAAGAGTLLALEGPLGAGKTQLAKGVARGLGVTNVVNSPTFVLMNEHEGRLRLFHVDAYRLDDPEEAIAAGLLDERQSEGIGVIEWADRLAGLLPRERLDIRLEFDPLIAERRILGWTAHGEAHARLASEALRP